MMKIPCSKSSISTSCHQCTQELTAKSVSKLLQKSSRIIKMKKTAKIGSRRRKCTNTHKVRHDWIFPSSSIFRFLQGITKSLEQKEWSTNMKEIKRISKSLLSKSISTSKIMEITTIISNPSLQPTEISPLKNPKDRRF